MKYIDADRLRAEIEKKRNEIVAKALDPDACIERIASAKYKKDALSDAISIIDSLQQEMELPEKYQTPDWLFEEPEQPNLPGIEDPGIPGKDFIPVEWVDACEMYGKWKIVKQDQPEVDLEKEIKNYLATKCAGDDEPSVSEIALHFYELGLNARKEE